ncbi:MAG: hypothetical protein ACAH95_08795 [Fimbriimonas sp.]
MIALAVASLAVHVFTFKGGDEHALASALSSAIQKPVTVMSSGGATFKPAEITYTSSRSLRWQAAKKFGLALGPGNGYGPHAWPKGFYRKATSAQEYLAKISQSKNFKVVALKENLIETADSGAGAIGLLDLKEQIPQAAITWNPFFQEARFALVAKSCTVQMALQSVAGAIGARLSKEGSGFRFDIDPSAYRKRTVAMCALPTRGDGTEEQAMQAADQNYLSELVQGLAFGQINKFMNGWAGSVPFKADSKVHVAASIRALVYRQALGRMLSEGRYKGGPLPGMLSQILHDDRVRARLRPDGTVCSEHMTRSGDWLKLTDTLVN